MLQKILITALLGLNATAWAQPSPAELGDLEERLRKVQELLNQLELQGEQVKAGQDKARPQPISFGTGNITLEQVMAWPVPSFTTRPGQTAHLGFNLNPLPEVKGYIEMEMIGSVALDRLLPQQEVTMERNNSRFLFKKGEIRFETDDYLLRAFHMVLRPDWYEEGDLFYLMPDATDPNKYFRQSGRGVPSGFQGAVKRGWLEGLDIWAGPELRYGAQPEAVARLRRRLGWVDLMLMGQWVYDPLMGSGKNMESNQEATLGLALGESTRLDLAGLRKATRVGQKYTDLQQVPAGAGISGTEWDYKIVETTESDALAAKLRLRSRALPFLTTEELVLEHAGPLAGNRTSVRAILEMRPQRSTLLSVEAGWQKPVVGVMPLIALGPPGLVTGVIGGPRPFGSPVSVGEDPYSKVSNREMTELVLTLEFNPGLGWFYKWRPRVVEGWNFNEDLVTPFSAALQARVFNYPGGTDLGSYVNETGTVVAEVSGTGLLPTNGYLGEYKAILRTQAGPVAIWAEGATGKDFMGLSPNFGSINALPAISYLRADLSARWRRLTLSGGYAEDIWGPDDFYRVFGLAIPLRYRASAILRFGRSEWALRYEGWRDKDTSRYRLFKRSIQTVNGPVDVEAPIDQVFASYTINF